MGAFEWLAKKVQNFTGETDRRKLVDDYDDIHTQFESDVSGFVEVLNLKVEEYNELIGTLNLFRQERVHEDIKKLGIFLDKFGTLNNQLVFSKERKNSKVQFPTKTFEKKEQYYNGINWDRDKIFQESFKNSLMGTKKVTQQLNLDIQERLNEYAIEIESTLSQLEAREELYKLEIQIAKLYLETIRNISETINKVIVPQLDFIEAFLIADQMKNILLAELEYDGPSNSLRIDLLDGTKYERHFNFIKVTFCFYVMSLKIYNAPVITNLLSNSITHNDLNTVQGYRNILKSQEEKLVMEAV